MSMSGSGQMIKRKCVCRSAVQCFWHLSQSNILRVQSVTILTTLLLTTDCKICVGSVIAPTAKTDSTKADRKTEHFIWFLMMAQYSFTTGGNLLTYHVQHSVKYSVANIVRNTSVLAFTGTNYIVSQTGLNGSLLNL